MLGVRINPELEAKLEAIAMALGRSKSDIAREALRRFVEAHDLQKEAREQSLRVAAVEGDADMLPFDERGWTA